MIKPLRSTAVALAIVIVTAAPAVGQQQKNPEELATEGLGKMVQALESLLNSIPQYEKPEITEDGDIIIRRKRDPERFRLPRPGDDTPTDREKSI